MILMTTAAGGLYIVLVILCFFFTSFLGLGNIPKWWDELKVIIEDGKKYWKLSKSKLIPEELLEEACRNRLDPLVELIDKAFYLWFVGGYTFSVIGIACGLYYVNENKYLLGFLSLAFITYCSSRLVVSLEKRLDFPCRKYDIFFDLFV